MIERENLARAYTQGEPLLLIDDFVQRATVEQQAAQAQVAGALLDELRAQPRRKNLDIANSQLQAAKAALKTAVFSSDIHL